MCELRAYLWCVGLAYIASGENILNIIARKTKSESYYYSLWIRFINKKIKYIIPMVAIVIIPEYR